LTDVAEGSDVIILVFPLGLTGVSPPPGFTGVSGVLPPGVLPPGTFSISSVGLLLY